MKLDHWVENMALQDAPLVLWEDLYAQRSPWEKAVVMAGTIVDLDLPNDRQMDFR